MDDDAQLERDLLLARRLKLAVRLVVYPLLLGLVALAFHVRHARAQEDDPHAPPTTAWSGRTNQGYPATATFQDGRLISFTSRLMLDCADGEQFALYTTVAADRIERPRRGMWVGTVADDHGVTNRGGSYAGNYSVHVQDPFRGEVIAEIEGTVAWHVAGTHNGIACRPGRASMALHD